MFYPFGKVNSPQLTPNMIIYAVDRAKHSFLLCPIPLSCLVVNKICLNHRPC